MMLVTIILMLSFGIGNMYPSGHFQYYPEDESPAETALRVLRGNDVQSSKPSAHISMGVTNPILGSGPQKSTWWWSPESPYMKRRQNLAYYNLNSFGLRYGKREQNMLAEFKQIPVK
ncbi:metastasis-suppressor KiSS-1 [Triplophysa rosa]|uniref:Kiss1 protein n=1 Tax=Triplophysa rosa TaxID=992332 RepID=A0A9W7WD80_TRIRA|nr:metastasis-suppressor KiSS-1 [Triplophysa rosa]KAI7794910.1 kiss1 protein [Triplophysa rosa]